ncbi:MAG: class I SAM-dependent methyltransferase [Candidatus Competibacteraceae bacterium]
MAVTFDPESWNRVYDNPHDIKDFVFRRGAELARDSCRELIRSGHRWLDLGCGTGQLMQWLSEAGACVVGVDHDLRMIEFTRRKAGGELRGVVAQGERLPFGDATLDGVVATSVMGCIPEAKCIYAEMYRVLRPHGCAVLTFTNRASWLLKLNYLATRPGGTKYYLYDAAGVTRELEGLGFQVLQTRFYNFVLRAGGMLLPPPSLARRLDGLGRHLFSRHWARNFIVVAQKRSAVR